MNLKPGEVSEIFSDPGGAYFIYKMISKETLTLEDVKTEIRTTISSQRYRERMKRFQGDVIFSDAYFNPPGKPATPPQRNSPERKSIRLPKTMKAMTKMDVQSRSSLSRECLR